MRNVMKETSKLLTTPEVLIPPTLVDPTAPCLFVVMVSWIPFAATSTGLELPMVESNVRLLFTETSNANPTADGLVVIT